MGFLMGFSLRKFKPKRLSKNEGDQNPPLLTMTLKVGRDPNSPFVECEFMIDTGLVGPALSISKKMAAELGVEQIAVADTQLPHGNEETIPMGQCTVIFGDQGFVGVSCLITDGPELPTVGLSFLGLFEAYILNGQIRHLKISEEALKALEPLSATRPNGINPNPQENPE